MAVLQEYLVLKPAEVALTKVQPQAGMPNSFFLGPFGFSTGVTALLAVQNMQMRFQTGDGNSPSKPLEAGDKVRGGFSYLHGTCICMQLPCKHHANTMQIPCKTHANTMQIPCKYLAYVLAYR